MVNFELKSRYDYEDLLRVVHILRSPGGCPWDQEQTHKSIRRDFLEEAYEAAEAIENGHEVEADMDAGVILDKTTGAQFKTAPFPPFIQKMIQNGGLMESIKKGEFR